MKTDIIVCIDLNTAFSDPYIPIHINKKKQLSVFESFDEKVVITNHSQYLTE